MGLGGRFGRCTSTLGICREAQWCVGVDVVFGVGVGGGGDFGQGV